MQDAKIIGIITDFGNRDGFVGVMEGVILGINPNVKIVEISNEIGRHSILEGAFILYNTYKYFPRNTIFLVVVDPGVGSEREGVVVQTNNYFFVGPNNGVLSLAAVEDGIVKIHYLENPKFFLSKVSQTFHGRDIFAPVVAYLSKGVKPSEFGSRLPLDRFLKLNVLEYKRRYNELSGTILYIDKFGNVITNIPNNELTGLEIGTSIRIIVDGEKKYNGVLRRTYSEGKRNELLLLEGSHGFIEIAINQGDAANYLNCHIGSKIDLIFD